MSRDELVHAYQNGRISRRAFVRALVALGVSIGTANHLADRALADTSHAHLDDVYGGGDGQDGGGGDGIGAGDKDDPGDVGVVDSHPDDSPAPVAVKQVAAPMVTKATATRTESTEKVTILPSTGSGERADGDGQ